MLNDLSKKDTEFRAFAFSLCKCSLKKDDLVNDMYLKIYEISKKYPKTKITPGYAFITIKNIFINSTKKKKNIELNDKIYLEANDNDSLKIRIEVNEILSKMDFVDRETLLYTSQNSARQMAREIGCSHQVVHNYKKKALEKFKKLWEDQEKKERV